MGNDALPTVRSRWWAVAALALALAAVAILVAVLTGDGEDETATRPPPSEASETTATTTTAPAQTTTSVAPQPTAAQLLEPFFAAAVTMDDQLRTAAAAINAAGPPWDAVADDLARQVQAADIEVVDRTIPAGLPAELLRSVILVYSDLSSRRAAMESFSSTRSSEEPFDRDLLAELANGHAAAVRFADDLAAARSLASSLPPFTVAAPDARPTAELLLLLQYVHKGNWGCDSRGGFVATELPPIDWQTETSGTIGDPPTEFTATIGPGRQWRVDILAC
jgi:hypothetical protein